MSFRRSFPATQGALALAQPLGLARYSCLWLTSILGIGGRIAFILPITLATGEAWGATRKLIADRYHLETVITSHDAERPNFSENTDLSELLFIARRLYAGETTGATAYINLWRNPRTII